MSAPFAYGDRVLLIDARGRRYLVALAEGRQFHTHVGYVEHAAIVGALEGSTVQTTKGSALRAFRPTLADFVLQMPRGAQVIYPKDIGPMLMLADIFPGARVFESGVGSGALSMAMLRAGAHITGYELRDDFAAKARANVAAFLGDEALAHYGVSVRDAYAGIDGERAFDRVVLDLPEPWRVVPHAATALVPGGILIAYTPSIVQASQVRDALAAGPWAMAATEEVLRRTWHIEGPSVRPDHRMVAHTGFLTTARLTQAPPTA